LCVASGVLGEWSRKQFYFHIWVNTLSPGYPPVGGYIGSRVSLNVVEKITPCPCQESNHDPSAVQPEVLSLYCPRYYGVRFYPWP
jgi:hypothetical protein